MALTRRRKWLIFGGIVATILAILAVVATIVVNRFEPEMRAWVIGEIEKKFKADVELAGFDIQAVPRLYVRGRGLSVKRKSDQSAFPLVKIDEFSFHMEWRELAGPTRHISLVHLKGMELNMPPRSNAPKAAKTEPPKAVAPKTEPEGAAAVASTLVVDRIVADKTLLRLLPRDSGKPPKEFDLIDLRLSGAGVGKPMAYQTKLINAKPPGLIDSVGHFGPYVADDPGESPLDGSYVFRDADLGVFKGIDGTLFSKGQFKGVLGRIEVDGESDTPDFELEMAGHKMSLKTKYHAIVDGTNGNTILAPVQAVLGRTPMTVSGSIEGEKNVKGKNIELDAVIQNGRLEDLIRLAAKGPKPALEGNIALKAKILIPRGPVHVIDKLGLVGTVIINNARFTNPEFQDKVDAFSRRARGASKEDAIDDVKSRIDGEFAMRDTVIHFSKLQYRVEGAEVDVIGHLGLKDEALDFDGVLRMDAKASQALGGFKSVFLKPFDSLVSRNGKGTVLSFDIKGTRSQPKFGLDVKRTLKKKDK